MRSLLARGAYLVAVVAYIVPGVALIRTLLHNFHGFVVIELPHAPFVPLPITQFSNLVLLFDDYWLTFLVNMVQPFISDHL